MTLGGVVAPAILACVAYDPKSATQSPLDEEGIPGRVCVLPAALLLLAMFIISKYELDAATSDKINKEIENRN